jgi:AbiTii
MKLLDELIELLSDQNGSLTGALLKTTVLMHKLGHKELAEWVNDELNGYGENEDVPPYRVLPARLMANLANAAWRQPNQMLPISHLPDDLQEMISQHKVRDSIRVLEQYATKPEGSLILPVPHGFKNSFGKTVVRGGWVESMWTQIEVTQIIHLLVEVRSKLLNFVLGVQSELGDPVSDADVKKASENLDVRAMFNHLVMGDNATLVVGQGNTLTIRNSVKKGDFSSLAAELKKNGVEQADITALKTAIDQDDAPVVTGQKNFGPAVEGWRQRMWGKVVDASWNIELGVAAGLLTEALKAFYGS